MSVLALVFIFSLVENFEQELCVRNAYFCGLCVVRSYSPTVWYLKHVSGEQESQGGWMWVKIELINIKMIMLAHRLGSLTFLCNPDYPNCTRYGENSQRVCKNSLLQEEGLFL